MEKYPFKFLNFYTHEDRDIFFGREVEIEALYQMVFQTDILLLYGASGTGKTSLVQCGLANKFKSYDWLDLNVRRGLNINVSLDSLLCEKCSDTHFLLDGIPPQNYKIEALGEKIRSIYLSSFTPIYLIFDQFEELYLLGDEEEQNQFISTVKEILQVEQPVKLIFIMREEYLGCLYEFEKIVPQLLHNKLRIEAMNFEKVRLVIEGATKKYAHSNFHLKEGEEMIILNKIFEKVKGKERTRTIQLPYLQVLMDKLYFQISQDENKKTEVTITENSVEQMGDMGDILREFLEEQVGKIHQKLSLTWSEISPDIVWQTLSFFATLEGTKKPNTLLRIQDSLPLDKALVENTIIALEDGRILRYSERDQLYEVAHDALARRIADKRSDEEIARLEVYRLIKNQMALKPEARELLSEKQLNFIETYEEKFGKLKFENEDEFFIKGSRKKIQEDKAIESTRQQKELDEAKKRAKIEQKLREEAENQTKRAKQRTWIAGIVAFAALIAAITAIVYFYVADNAKKLAETAKEESEKSRIKADSSLEHADSINIKNEKLIDAFYFYDDKFALAFNIGGFGFINKEGDVVIDYKYKTLGQFDEIGLAKATVKGGSRNFNYLVDTSGNQYLVAYSLANLTPKIRAIDLRDNPLDSFPVEIFNYPKLEVILLEGLLSKRMKYGHHSRSLSELKNLKILSLKYFQWDGMESEIRHLNNLKILDLKNNSLDSLTWGIGRLKKLESLNLNFNSLRSLPPEIGELKELKSLITSSNRLYTLPSEITNLRNLEIFYLGGGLKKIPTNFGDFQKLKILSLTIPDIMVLSTAIKKFKQLETLILEGRGYLPKEIGELKKLKKFHLKNYRLNSLPVEIGELKMLNDLLLSGVDFDILPAEIGKLTELNRLTIVNSRLDSIPQTIGELKNLKYLNVSFCHLKALPAEIGQLTKLKTMKLWLNGLEKLPPEIGKLKNLETLNIENNKLKEFPVEIGQLESLIYIYASGNKIESLPNEIGRLENLEYLILEENKLRILPSGIGQLKRLKDLNIENNQLKELPSEIGQLESISMLRLENNMLSGLPPEIGDLKELYNIDLKKNHLYNLPPEIGELKKLYSIDLRNNHLYSLPEEILFLENLRYMHLRNNNLTRLPSGISKLKKLSSLDLRGNNLERGEWDRIKDSLPRLFVK